MSSLVKQMCALKCRIKVDIEEGAIYAVEMDDNDVEDVIDSVNEAFDILAVDIIPTVEIPEPVITEDSFKIAKIEFSNPKVEEQVNKLMRTIAWAMYSNKAPVNDICQFLMSIGREIRMTYSPYDQIKFKIGDVVACDYGNHHSGEVSGVHVHAVVCDIDDEGLVYAAPITKARIGGNPQKYMRFEAKTDVDYIESKFAGGTVLLRKGGYIRPERIQSVVGVARPDFFQKLLAVLPKAINFSRVDYAEELAERHGDVQNDDHLLEFVTGLPAGEVLTEEVNEIPAEETPVEGMNETPAEEGHVDGVNETLTEEVPVDGENETPAEETPVERVEKHHASNKKLSAEEYLATLVGSSLEALDKSKPEEEQIDMFLDSIGLPKNERIIKQSFIAACEVMKVDYEHIINYLHNTTLGKVREDLIKATMREEFKKWIANYPEAKEKYPKISFIALLKVFAKKKR